MSMANFDWTWPKNIDKEAALALLSLGFVEQRANAILLGPNGVGKTMLMREIALRAALRGHTVRFTTASDMLRDLAADEAAAVLERRLRRYCQPRLLCIDDVGDRPYDSRCADLFCEVVTRRYQVPRSIILSTNKPFSVWSQVFSNAACLAALVERLLHRCELLTIEGDSFQLDEATERAPGPSPDSRG
jgi:DNA replication protein DnaC